MDYDRDKACTTCEHNDFCDWWLICTGVCEVCEKSGFNIVEWCHNNCAAKRMVDAIQVDNLNFKEELLNQLNQL